MSPDPSPRHDGGGPGPEPPAAGSVLGGRLRVPPVPATFVRRTRLSERLTLGLRERPLALVNGPAGAGKTLLVCDWARTAPLPGPAAWLTLEPGDNTPGALWACLTEALRRAGAVPPGRLPAAPGAAATGPELPGRLADALAERPEPLVLILDEAEHLTDPGLAADLHTLLRHAGDGLRLVLISRTEPPLPLHRYRAADEITEIRAADLAFTPDEAAVLLRRHGLALSAEGVRALTERTEGWAAGLRLSALAAEHAPDREGYLKEFEAGHSTIADFLLAEVLDAQPAATRDLLLRTSVLDRAHPALADALTGRPDGERILDELAHANAFVTPMDHSWYRLHPLFAEILRVHLRARHPGLQQELHGTAARWLHAADLPDEALRHAAAAGEWELAAGWLVRDLALGRFLTDPGLAAAPGPAGCGALFAELPPDTGGPATELVRAARSLAARDADAAVRHLDRAERRSTAGTAQAAGVGLDGDRPDGDDLRLGAALLRVAAARLTGAVADAERAAATAERLLPRAADRTRRDRPQFTALLAVGLGAVRLWDGRIDAARQALAGVLRPADPAEPAEPAPTAGAPGVAAAALPGRYEALGLLALAQLWDGAPGRAEAHARRAIAAYEQLGLPETADGAIARLVLAEVAAERDDPAAAQLELQRAESLADHPGDRPGDRLRRTVLALTRARLALHRGDPHGALALLGHTPPRPDPEDEHSPEPDEQPWTGSPWAESRVAALVAAALLATGDASAALLAAARGGSDGALVAARAHLRLGDPAAAVAA
ncbi:AAA family ATPase, partial [Kitasatospora cinereorecta]|uniref:AAA family ATPase n=1 Tax=Kitasatospora cinereorecta TaxID=285560 RepID=UPI0031F7D9AC